jgi:hypothetical protein
MFLLQWLSPLAKGFPDQSCEVTEGVMYNGYKSCLRHVRWLGVNKTCIKSFLRHVRWLGVNKTCSIALPTPCEVARCEWGYGRSLAYAM